MQTDQQTAEPAEQTPLTAEQTMQLGRACIETAKIPPRPPAPSGPPAANPFGETIVNPPLPPPPPRPRRHGAAEAEAIAVQTAATIGLAPSAPVNRPQSITSALTPEQLAEEMARPYTLASNSAGTINSTRKEE